MFLNLYWIFLFPNLQKKKKKKLSFAITFALTFADFRRLSPTFADFRQLSPTFAKKHDFRQTFAEFRRLSPDFRLSPFAIFLKWRKSQHCQKADNKIKIAWLSKLKGLISFFLLFLNGFLSKIQWLRALRAVAGAAGSCGRCGQLRALRAVVGVAVPLLIVAAAALRCVAARQKKAATPIPTCKPTHVPNVFVH